VRFLQGRDDRVKAAIDDQAWILEDAKPSRAEALDYGIGNMALFTWFDEALFGITFGGIGERTGTFPTEREYDNVARALEAASQYAKKQGLQFGIEPVNRYENHLINTGWQAVEMIERVGSENLFVHLDTYHMNIEEKGAGNGILDAREHLKYIHLSESDRGTR